MNSISHMRREILEIPQATQRLLELGDAQAKQVALALRDADPDVILTVARGSSDHVASYFKYACELTLGIPVASIGPSIASIYGARLRLRNAACFAISQSGQSPDIVAMARSATEQGAVTLSITNQDASPLADQCDHALNIHAGPEKSVAATKSYVSSAVAALMVLAHWANDRDLLAALQELPGCFAEALRCDWSTFAPTLEKHQSVYVLGRGPSFAIATEAALKLKETCQLHAESYSSAEVLHGPVAVVGQGYPILALASADAAEASVVSVADVLKTAGASVFVTSDKAVSAVALPAVRNAHALTDALCLIVSFYAFAENLAVAKGINPDQPRHLKKVTETV